MLTFYNKIQELEISLPHLNLAFNNNFDASSDIREFDSKTIVHPLYKEGGFDEEKLERMINQIPASEISEDIELMYNYLRDHI